MKLSSVFLAAASACMSVALTPQEWKSKSIYFIMTDRFARTDGSTTAPCNLDDRKYCGGSWRGIINKLDYIKGMGFNAIWITPVTHQIEGYTKYGEAFHGYWQNDLYSLNSHLGTPDDLKALSSALHSKGMYLMVDVVANHFAWSGTPYNVDYSTYRPFNDKSYFHTPCNIDNYDNQTQVEDCWLAFNSGVELPDLDTRQARVKNLYYNWISSLTKTYGIDGLRVDTVKHVQKDFWPGFNRASGVYNVGEVFSGDPNYLCPYQDVMDGILNYVQYFPLTRAFSSSTGSMTDLASNINQTKALCKDTNLLGSFLENHDNPRFANITSDFSLAKNAIAFMILADGIPILYYGQEQHFSGGNDPYDREALWLSGYKTDAKSAPLYPFIGTVNGIRNLAVKEPGYTDSKAVPFYTDANTIAMRKGTNGCQTVGVFSNKGEKGNTYNLDISGTGFAPGSEVTEIFTCKKQKVGANGKITVAMAQGLPRIFYPSAKLGNSGICSSQWS